MKDLLSSILESTFKWLVGAVLAFGSAFVAVETWVDKKVEAAEKRVMKIRSIDMGHLDKRLDTIEKLIKAID